jgi:hypothetical protein
VLENNEKPVITPIFSPEKIKELNQLMRDKVAEVMRLQREGILPYASKLPRCHVERKDVIEILGKSDAQAGRIMAECRKKFPKKKGQYTTVEEFCETTGLNRFDVQRALDLLPMMHYLPAKDKPRT